MAQAFAFGRQRGGLLNGDNFVGLSKTTAMAAAMTATISGDVARSTHRLGRDFAAAATEPAQLTGGTGRPEAPHGGRRLGEPALLLAASPTGDKLPPPH